MLVGGMPLAGWNVVDAADSEVHSVNSSVRPNLIYDYTDLTRSG